MDNELRAHLEGMEARLMANFDRWERQIAARPDPLFEGTEANLAAIRSDIDAVIRLVEQRVEFKALRQQLADLTARVEKLEQRGF